MTCKHCCGADQLFDLKHAQGKAKRYDKKGPSGASRHLIKNLRTAVKNSVSTKSPVNKAFTLLDIGGGIGTIGLELKKDGLESVTLVDASTGFLKVAEEEYEKHSSKDLLQIQFGDFLDLQDSIGKHDIVTLDKVICCYPDAWELIKQSSIRCNRYYALVFPWGGPFGHFFARVGNWILRIFYNNGFHTYVHDVPKVFETVKQQGFSLLKHQKRFPWHIVIWERKNWN